jgi:hypothetical protein
LIRGFLSFITTDPKNAANVIGGTCRELRRHLGAGLPYVAKRLSLIGNHIRIGLRCAFNPFRKLSGESAGFLGRLACCSFRGVIHAGVLLMRTLHLITYPGATVFSAYACPLNVPNVSAFRHKMLFLNVARELLTVSACDPVGGTLPPPPAGYGNDLRRVS